MISNKRYKIINLDKFKNKKIVCLTLDVEQDYGDLLDEPSYEAFSCIDVLIDFLKEKSIPLTCFVQGSLFETHPYVIEQLSTLDVEFEVHTYSHPKPGEINHKFEIKRGRDAFRKFFGKEPLGYRSSSGVVSEEMFSLLPLYGFKFDSSVVPSLRPGVYNSLTKPIIPYFLCNSIIEFPVTVFSKLLRIPISLSYLKLLGKPYLDVLKKKQLPNLVIFSFHLHDLKILNSSSKIPFEKFPLVYRLIFKRIYKNNNGMKLLKDFIDILLQKDYTFLKLKEVYKMLI